MDHAFGVVFKKSLPNLSRFPPMLSSSSFIVSHFIFKFVAHFEFIFCDGCKVGVASVSRPFSGL